MELSQNLIVERVKEAGIVGRGGGGFPTHVKINTKVDIVIANGAECEPLLHSDKAFMKREPELICKGLKLVQAVTEAKRAIIALKGVYGDIVEKVKKVASSYGIEVFELGNYYPAGDEHILVNEVTGKVIPEGGIPLNVGVVVNNVITLRDIALAVEGGVPVTDRPLTVHGEVNRPVNLVVPIGTPIKRVLELADGAKIEQFKVIEGGPAMGKVVTNLEEPIKKTTSGIIVLPNDHPAIVRKDISIKRELLLAKAVCCQCQFCTQLCPRHLLGHNIYPHLVMRAINHIGYNEPPSNHITTAFLCSQCGVCEFYACPMGLSPRKVYGIIREELIKSGISNPHRRTEITPREFYRLRRAPLERVATRLGLYKYLHREVETDWNEYEIDRVKIPLKQHTGVSAEPVVKIGDKVKKGELIGKIPEGKLGANVHASIDGVVEAVTKEVVIIRRGNVIY